MHFCEFLPEEETWLKTDFKIRVQHSSTDVIESEGECWREWVGTSFQLSFTYPLYCLPIAQFGESVLMDINGNGKE